MRYTRTTALLLAATILSAPPALAQDNPTVGGAPMMADQTIVENAMNSPIHKTLVAAVKQAGLVDTLQGDGPFTVFAPTDEAFAALPEGTVETLMQPENKEQLQKILTCHVVAAEAFSDAIAGMIEDDGGRHAVPTVGGCTLQAYMEDGEIRLEDERGNVATVTTADVDQSNGVIHVIDTVLLPAEDSSASDDSAAMKDDAEPTTIVMQAGDTSGGDASGDDMAMAGDNPTVGGAPMKTDRNIVENAVNSPIHKTLVAAVKQAGLVETLQGEGPFTVFAPTDEAFAALPEGTVETLMQPENKDQLTKILTAHVVPGTITAQDIRTNANSDGFYNMTAVSGDALSAKVQPSGSIYVFDEHGDAYEIGTADVMQSNGVIHVVDGVLLPR